MKNLRLQRAGDKGLTLVETVVYVGLLAGMLVLVTNSMLSMSLAYKPLKSAKAVNTAALTALDRMTREIRQAESVNTAQSTLNSAYGRLNLATEKNGSDTTVDFSLQNGAVVMSQGGTSLGSLTPAAASTTNLTFRLITTPVSEAVKIEMTVESGTGTAFRSANFQDTVILRGSYQGN